MKVAIIVLLAQSFTCVLSAFLGSMYKGGNEYAYFADHGDDVSFCVAEIKCGIWRQDKGTLARPDSLSINNALAKLSRYRTTWIGATDMQGQNYWVWFGGRPLTWVNWEDGEPNNYKGTLEDCVQMKTRGKWNDAKCNIARGYVCQAPSGSAGDFEYSTFTTTEDDTTSSTFEAAKSHCEGIGARLVKVENQKSLSDLLEKLNKTASVSNFWISVEGIKPLCAVVRNGEIEYVDCEEVGYGIVCEKVAPHDLQVSDEAPILSASEDHQIDCTASGYPTPNVVWHKNGKVVDNQMSEDGKSTLIIRNAAEKDAGDYYCHATNAVNKEKHDISTFTNVAVHANIE